MPLYGLGPSSLLIWLIHHSDAAKWVLSRGQINVTSKLEPKWILFISESPSLRHFVISSEETNRVVFLLVCFCLFGLFCGKGVNPRTLYMLGLVQLLSYNTRLFILRWSHTKLSRLTMNMILLPQFYFIF